MEILRSRKQKKFTPEEDAAGGRRDRDFLVQRSRFLAALKTRLGLGENTSRLRKIDLSATNANQGTTRLPGLEKRRLRYQRSYDCRLGYRRIHGPTSRLPDPFIYYLSTT